MNMADPLSLLREYNVNKKEIIERDNHIIFGEFSWPKTVETNYVMYRSKKDLKKDNTPRKYYTLECLLFLLKNLSWTHPTYARKSDQQKIPRIRRPDRNELLAYLKGETASCAGIDKSAPIEPPTLVKRSADYDGPESFAKKPKLEDTHDQILGEKFSNKLDGPKESSVIVDNIGSLSDAMSIEKIAAIKAKRLAKKRTTIKGNDDIDQEYDIPAIPDLDVDITKDIISRERQWKTQTTIL